MFTICLLAFSRAGLGVKSRSLRMSWVVVTDDNGNRELRQQWAQQTIQRG